LVGKSDKDKLGSLSEGQRDYWRSKHELEQLRHILAALGWAEEHPAFPFSSLLPNLKFADETLYKYLCQIKGDFEEIVEELEENVSENSGPG
jgi:hypothetical protein